MGGKQHMHGPYPVHATCGGLSGLLLVQQKMTDTHPDRAHQPSARICRHQFRLWVEVHQARLDLSQQRTSRWHRHVHCVHYAVLTVLLSGTKDSDAGVEKGGCQDTL